MLVLAALFLAPGACFQDPAAAQDPPAPRTVEEVVQLYEQRGVSMHAGPFDGDMGPEAHIAVPAGFYFLDAGSARKLLELNENLTSGQEVGALWHAGDGLEQSWWVFFEFSKDGYVKDDDQKIDADELLSGMKEGNKSANEERKKRGWSELQLLGWHKPPFYDPQTHNLTWSKLVESDGHKSINWSTRLLGRNGVMSVDLVLAPERLDAALPLFASMLTGFEYKSGSRYAEFKAGDRIAEYGLAALVAGGAGALALKSGLLAKLWKLILIPILGVGAWLKRLFTGRKAQNEDPQSPSP
jgi:uncharacterized membrane-anchored protein